MIKVKLTDVGTSADVINVGKDDVLHAANAPDRGDRLTPQVSALAAKIEKADDIMRRYWNTLSVPAQ